MTEQKKYRFQVGIAKKDVTRLALLQWVKTNVGELTSGDLSKHHYSGVNWDIKADLPLYTMDWMFEDEEEYQVTSAYFVTIEDDTAAVMFKLSWPRAIELK